MSNKLNNAAEQYLQEKRIQGRGAYEQGDTSFFMKSIEALSTPFRWGAEGLTSLFLRAQDSTLSEAEAYRLATGNRAGKEWYESGEAPVTLGQSFYGAITPGDIDWSNSSQVQKYFSTGSQKFISGGVDAVASIALDPLNLATGGTLGASTALFRKIGKLDNVVDMARVQSISAKNFDSLTDYFKYTQEAFSINPNLVGGLRIGTPAYTEEVTRLQPYFKQLEEFKDSYPKVEITPLSDTASYIFDGTMIRAVDGDKFYTYSIQDGVWHPEPVLSPQIAEIAKAQFSHSGFLNPDELSTKGFEVVKDYAKVKRIRTFDGQFLPDNLKFGIWRFTDNTEHYIAYNPKDGSYWALSDKPIQEYYLPDESKVVETAVTDTEVMDSALYDVLNYEFNNGNFTPARDFYNENPKFFTLENFDQGAFRKYFMIEDKVYSRHRNGTYQQWDSITGRWYNLKTPKVKDSNKQLELETRLNEKRDGYINAGEDEVDDVFPDSQADDFYNEMDNTDEYLSNDPTEYSTNWIPDGMQVDEIPVDTPIIGGIFEKRWYPMDKSNIENYGLAYSLRYTDQFGIQQQAWVPADMAVISRNTDLAQANKTAFPIVPLLRTKDNEVFTFGFDGSIIDIATAHRMNELFRNFILEETTKRTKLLANPLRKFKQPESRLTKEEKAAQEAAQLAESTRINAERKLIYEKITAQLALLKVPTKAERRKFDDIAETINDPNRVKPVNELTTPDERELYDRITQYDFLRKQQMSFARTKEEAEAADEAAKIVYRDAEIEDKLLSDPEYKVAAHEWFAQGKSGQRPITISFWYEKTLNENGTYTIRQMGRRTDFDGFGDESGALAVKEWEIFRWENISIKDLQKMSYRSKEDYPDGLILPNNTNIIKTTIGSENEKTFWDILSNPDEPVVTVNIDELDTFGRKESQYLSDRLTPRRHLDWEKADKKVNGYFDKNGVFVPGLVDKLLKRKANATAMIEKGNTKYKAALEHINKELEYYQTYFVNEVAYENGIIDGMVRREVGPGKPELWFLNLEDALNRIAGTSHDVNAATVGFMGRDVARITPLTKAEKKAEEAMRKAAKSERKTEFPLERKPISSDAEAKPLDIEIPEDIKAIGAEAERKAKLKAGTLKADDLSNYGTVVRVKDNVPGAIYIGRAGRGKSGEFGNPFPVRDKSDEAVKEAVAKYDTWLAEKIKTDPEYANKIYALKGKTLACPGPEANEICHGQSILKAIKYLDENPQLLGKATDIPKSSDVVIHSGGAEGADTEWAIAGDEVGISTKGYSFKGHTVDEGMSEKSAGFKGSRPAMEERVVLTDEELLSNRDELLLAGENIHYAYNKFIPNGKTVSERLSELNRLIYRNAYQVNNSDAVIAVGRFAKRNNDSFRRNVDGGTGWAVELGIVQNKPVYFYDLDSNKWINFDYSQNDWVAIEGLPPTFNNFAGIGTRGLTEQGKQAIRDYLSQFKKAE